jgi:hypothetical protein
MMRNDMPIVGLIGPSTMKTKGLHIKEAMDGCDWKQLTKSPVVGTTVSLRKYGKSEISLEIKKRVAKGISAKKRFHISSKNKIRGHIMKRKKNLGSGQRSVWMEKDVIHLNLDEITPEQFQHIQPEFLAL